MVPSSLREASPRRGRFALALLLLLPVPGLIGLDRGLVHWTGLCCEASIDVEL